MNVRPSRHEDEGRRIARVLRSPLPPARPHADPSALWACGRHARRISTEAKISLVATGAQVLALAGVLGVLVAFIDWRGAWTSAAGALAEPHAGIYAALGVAATGAAALAAQLLQRKA